MLFALAAVPGSLLIARTRHQCCAGGRTCADRDRRRAARRLPDVMWLYAMTIAMGAGVAIMQVTMPPAVRAWVPHRIGVRHRRLYEWPACSARSCPSC